MLTGPLIGTRTGPLAVTTPPPLFSLEARGEDVQPTTPPSRTAQALDLQTKQRLTHITHRTPCASSSVSGNPARTLRGPTETCGRP